MAGLIITFELFQSACEIATVDGFIAFFLQPDIQVHRLAEKGYRILNAVHLIIKRAEFTQSERFPPKILLLNIDSERSTIRLFRLLELTGFAIRDPALVQKRRDLPRFPYRLEEADSLLITLQCFFVSFLKQTNRAEVAATSGCSPAIL